METGSFLLYLMVRGRILEWMTNTFDNCKYTHERIRTYTPVIGFLKGVDVAGWDSPQMRRQATRGTNDRPSTLELMHERRLQYFYRKLGAGMSRLRRVLVLHQTTETFQHGSKLTI